MRWNILLFLRLSVPVWLEVKLRNSPISTVIPCGFGLMMFRLLQQRTTLAVIAFSWVHEASPKHEKWNREISIRRCDFNQSFPQGLKSPARNIFSRVNVCREIFNRSRVRDDRWRDNIERTSEFTSMVRLPTPKWARVSVSRLFAHFQLLSLLLHSKFGFTFD